jgi:hypothetical protein
MGKRLSTGAHFQRAVARGWSVDDLAAFTGRSKNYIQKVIRGGAPAENLFETARDLGKGKRSVTPPPLTRQQATKARERGQAEVRREEVKRQEKIKQYLKERAARGDALAKAERRLDRLHGTERYVIHVTSKKTGQSFTLCRKGGVSPEAIRKAPSLDAFIAAQGAGQGYATDEIDWADIVDIEFEEYY